VLRRTKAGKEKWLIIEAKMGERRSAESSARAALIDLLAYREAFQSTLSPAQSPYGLGIVWGQDLEPATGSDIMLCTPEHIRAALALGIG
jgi:hypothetical protein